MGYVKAGGTSLFPSSGCFWGRWPQPPQLYCRLPSSNNFQRFLGVEWGPPKHSTTVGEGGEGLERVIKRWQAGYMERGPSKRQGNLEPWTLSLGPSLVPKNLSGSRPAGSQATSGDLNGFANFPDS